MVTSRCIPLRMRIISHKFAEIIKTRILCSITFSDIRGIYEIMWKIMVKSDRQQIQYTKGACACMLDNWRCRHTLRICYTYCFSLATVVTQTRLDVMFIHTLALFVYSYQWDSVIVRVTRFEWLTHYCSLVFRTVAWTTPGIKMQAGHVAKLQMVGHICLVDSFKRCNL